eukprot:TRINITY_DN50559_c0_g1_i1.p1 TRINITY_DN50559_c0_g1~~TRINITY_DN50559_c0_g1_i1.p1  ORF type:complete len:203 (-),score=8.78 TRINITY_DN50559_c0_g1_i1:61-669(-)
MGLFSSKLHSLITGRRNTSILQLGLDAAGKTTILYRLKLSDLLTDLPPPTIGFSVEEVQYKNFKLITWDIGGRCRMRPLWKHYFTGVDALIFVVDSNDRDRIDTAREELEKLLDDDQLKAVPILVWANKQDLPSALSAGEVVDKLGLHRVQNRQWFVQASVATTGDGLVEGLDWLQKTLEGEVDGLFTWQWPFFNLGSATQP